MLRFLFCDSEYYQKMNAAYSDGKNCFIVSIRSIRALEFDRKARLEK